MATKFGAQPGHGKFINAINAQRYPPPQPVRHVSEHRSPPISNISFNGMARRHMDQAMARTWNSSANVDPPLYRAHVSPAQAATKGCWPIWLGYRPGCHILDGIYL